MPVLAAIRRCRKLLADAATGGQANVFAVLAALEAMRGRFGEARRLWRGRGSVRGARAGFSCGGELWDRRRANRVGGGGLRSGGAAPAIHLPGAGAAGDRAYLATAAAEFANVLCLGGQFDEADELDQPSRRRGRGGRHTSLRPWLAHGQGEAPGSETASSVTPRNLHGKPLVDRGDRRAHRRADFSSTWRDLAGPGSQGEAGEAVEQAIDLFDRKGNVVGATRARGQLAELAWS